MRFVIFAAALALVACSKPAQQQAPSAATTAATTAAASGPADKGVSGAADAPVSTTPVATTPVVSSQFMIGTWGDNGDCSKDIVINDDGSFTSYSGGEGQWSLNGNTLRLEGKNGTFDMQLAPIDQNTVRITNPDGSVGTSQRCD